MDFRKPRLWAAVLILLALARWWLGTTPGYPHDLGAYKRWALWGATHGIHTLYERESFYDYPPLYGYLLAPLGQIAALADPDYARAYLDPASGRPPGYSPLFSLLVKLPPLAFDVLLALLLARLAVHHGLWPPGRSQGGRLPALLYLLNPAVLFLSGYWGQPDAIEIYFVLLGLSLILLRKPEAGWIAAALGLLMKPVAAPFLPLLALATLLRCGWRRLLTGGAAALATFAAGLLPFLIAGRGAQVASRLLLDVDAMPYTSVNAHNLWWLLGPWRPAGEAVLGPITPTMIGLALFGLVYGAVLLKTWRRERLFAGASGAASDDGHWYLAAAAVGFAFFTFSTHMHENHLYPALPFLLIVLARDRRWLWTAAGVTAIMLANMWIHDYYTGMAWLSKMGTPSSFQHPDFHRPLSTWEMSLATANALACVAGCLLFLTWVLSGGRRRVTR